MVTETTHDTSARTTSSSASEGRLRVDTGTCPHGRGKKCLKCVMHKDGKGGHGVKLNPLALSIPKTPSSFKSFSSSIGTGKPKKVSMKSIRSSLRSLIKHPKVKNAFTTSKVFKPKAAKLKKIKSLVIKVK